MRGLTSGAASVAGTGSTTATGFTAMVLAGGLGTRLRAAVADRSKVMALVDGEPFLARLLDPLAAAGCTRAILCLGHLGEQIEREFGGDHAGMAVVCSHESSPLGTGGALRLALPLLDSPAALVLNGDSYCDIDLRDFVTWAAANDVPAMVAVAVPDTTRYGTVDVSDDGAVRAFTEKRTHGASGLVNAGIYWLPRAVLDRIPAGLTISLERQVLPRLAGHGLLAFRTASPFLDIGTPASFGEASAFFAACAQRRARDRKGLLVVDRDGTLIEERHYLGDRAGVALLPGVVEGLRAFAANGYELAIVTNQSGIGRGFFDEQALADVHRELRQQLAQNGITIHGIWHCPHHPDHGCACRKPAPLLLERAMQELGYEPAQCLVVGDKACDIELGARLGVRTALVRTGYGVGTERDGMCTPDVVVDDLHALALQEVPS